ncbi:MAG: Shikimate kinase [Chlamydiia bacterium]|nr:Shikimate kinase [Chlamydiia bacterium]
MIIVLFGFKKCGKTYYGRLLAKRMHFTFIDTDRLIEDLYFREEGYKITCRQIHQDLGESAFRAYEQKVISEIKHKKNAVISVGGGAVLHENNLLALGRIGTLVYLKASKETIEKRILSDELPSYLNPHEPEQSFERMYRDREPKYVQVKAREVEIDNKKDDEVLKELEEIIKQTREINHGAK